MNTMGADAGSFGRTEGDSTNDSFEDEWVIGSELESGVGRPDEATRNQSVEFVSGGAPGVPGVPGEDMLRFVPDFAVADLGAWGSIRPRRVIWTYPPDPGYSRGSAVTTPRA
jgi:hypothetical protein